MHPLPRILAIRSSVNPILFAFLKIGTEKLPAISSSMAIIFSILQMK